MKQIVNQAYKPLYTTDKRYIILMGGRGAGRSTVASQYAVARLMAPGYLRCAIMRYIGNDIRDSIYREITDRVEEQDLGDEVAINSTTMTLSHGVNSINAKSFKKSTGDQKAKLKSLANYNAIIIEEADEVAEEDFMQLDDSLRTLKGDIKIILLLNPPAKNHWIITRWFDLKPHPTVQDFYEPSLKPEITDTLYLRTSYLDNIKNIAEPSVVSYERYAITKPSHYWNMIRGFVPETVRGKIYKGWQEIEEVPHEARLERYGLDFGYTNDPTALVAVYRYNGGIILDEVAYSTGLSNAHIAAVLANEPTALVIADSAEPKSIDDLKDRGVLVQPSVKGNDSVRSGIMKVQEQRISYTKRSRNIKKEFDTYAWLEKKDGTTINEPKPGSDHAMDALRYAITSLLPEEEPQEEHVWEEEKPLFSSIGL